MDPKFTPGWQRPFDRTDFFALMREIEALVPPRYCRYVLLASEVVAQLQEKPSDPLTVKIEDGDNGRVIMTFHEHKCETNASLVEQLAQARAERDQWEAIAADENARRRAIQSQMQCGAS